MAKKTASQRRFEENALLIAALELVFKQLYKDYSTKPIEEIADTASGGTPLRNIRSYYGGEIPWIKSGELNDGLITKSEEYITQEGLENSSAKIFPKDTLVVALYGATVGKTGILELGAASNQAVCAVTPKTNEITSKFLFWFFRYKRPEYLGVSFGGAQPNISQKIIRETFIPIPPLELQKVLSEFFSVVEQKQKRQQADYPILPEKFANAVRIVEYIEALARKINEVKGIKQEIGTDLDRMLLSAYHSIADNAVRKPMEQVAPLTRRLADVNVGQNYPQVSVRSFGRGTFHKPELDGGEITWQKPYLVKSGDILISNIKAWEGAIAVASESDDGRYGSHRYLTCVPIPNVATSRFVCFHLLTSEGLYEVGQASPGSADRNRTLGAKALMQIPIPVPPIEKQLWFDNLYAKVASLWELQSATGQELDALLPSVLDRAFKGEL